MIKKILLILFLFSGVSYSQIFYDDFEKWTATYINGWFRTQSGMVVSTYTVVKTGSYGLRVTDSNTTTSTPEGSILVSNLLKPPTVYIRTYVKFKAGFWDTMQANSGINLLRWEDGTDYVYLYTQRAATAADTVFYLSGNNFSAVNSPVKPIANQWYCLEVMLGSFTATSQTKWWIDGQQQPTITDEDRKNLIAPNQFWVGTMWSTPATATHEAYFDEFVINNSYIGLSKKKGRQIIQ